jgi:23S rRNA (cytosine1962-C5)-methyltransferase
VGSIRLIRPAAEAIWCPGLPAQEWERAAGEFVRRPGGEGGWETRNSLPESFEISVAGVTMIARLTSFGHIGVFPEQVESWQRAADLVGRAGRPVSVLCLFAYTGASTLVCAKAGARVCHVDASKGTVDWARRNAEASGLADRPIRWIVEDVGKFLSREERRGSRYDAIILDPPTYGRGTRGEMWKIEEHLPGLLDLCRKVLSDDPLFVLLHGYTAWLPMLSLRNVMEDSLAGLSGTFEHGELSVAEEGRGRRLPRGMFVRFEGR